MNEPDAYNPLPADLAACEAELPEWDRLRVRDFWDAVIAAELGARPPRMPVDQRPVLRLIPGGKAPGQPPADQGGRAA